MGSASLQHEGYALLRGVESDTAARLLAELVALDRAAAPEDVAVSGAYRRVWGIVERVPGVAALVLHPEIVARAHEILGPEIVVQNVCAHVVGAGAPQQFLHADQQSAPLPWTHPSVMTAVWMLEAFSEAHGATRVVPRTHEHQSPPPYGSPLPESVPVCGAAGQVLVMDGRLWHHAGDNHASRPRFAVLVTYARPEVSRHPRFAEGERAVVRDRLAPLTIGRAPAA